VEEIASTAVRRCRLIPSRQSTRSRRRRHHVEVVRLRCGWKKGAPPKRAVFERRRSRSRVDCARPADVPPEQRENKAAGGDRVAGVPDAASRRSRKPRAPSRGRKRPRRHYRANAPPQVSPSERREPEGAAPNRTRSPQSTMRHKVPWTCTAATTSFRQGAPVGRLQSTKHAPL
jgi:hypothetical protein